ncbi:MAG: UDP-glucose 4-epimerase GalE [Chlamydiae bacterium]|nr:UDP-glucose 4-epimerase GalE [Chlamydiota bacterium]MBI3276477.1 UDP-glucose 4-epimerase GalE [Chlamydiota bacterium]
MKILLTGGAGYIGSVTAKLLIDHGHELTIIDDLSEGHLEALDPRAAFVQGDLGNADVLHKAFSKDPFDAVMHFAGSCLVPESVEHPSLYYHNNVVNGLLLLETMRENGVPKIIFSSSCAVYGEPEKTPITEMTPQKPTHPYGETKFAFEKALKWYAKAYEITAILLRYFNAAGATDHLGEDHATETHLIPNVLKAALNELPYVNIYGTDYPTPDGTCIRDYVHVLDIAQAHILALELEESESFNLGNGSGYSVRQVIQTAEKVCEMKIPVKECNRRIGDPPILVASSQKIQQVLGWIPKHPSLEEIMRSAWRWTQKHPKGYASTNDKNPKIKHQKSKLQCKT